MKPNELAARKDEFLVVDVREDAEWDAGHIPGSIHIRLSRIGSELDALDLGRPVVTVCRTGPRSERAVQALKAAGRDAEHLSGGVAAWSLAGQPLVDAAGKPGTVGGQEQDQHHDHDGHDHDHHEDDGHDQGPMNPELEALQDDFLAIAMALQERFGEREPTDQEAKDFMREWLEKQGKSPEEIDRILND